MSQYKYKFNCRSGVFDLVPSTIIVFKASVANYAALPAVGNTIGDARITEDTDHWYSWDGSVWNDQGVFIASNWENINGRPSSPVADIDDAVTKRHTQNTDTYLDNIVKNVLYVDGNRTDVYTANGSITKPFKKIQDAIDAVTAPSATNKYLIEIAPGAYYSDAIAINKVYVTFRSCGIQGARISGAITVTNPSDPTPEQITFVGLRISGGLTCLASHICINAVDCNITGSDWVMNPTVPTDDEYLQVFGGLYNVTTTLTNVYTYLMGGGYYCTFVATNKEFNINNADINDPFQVTLNGTVIASAYGDRTGNSKFIVNAGATLNIDADTEGGSVLTLDPAAILNRTTIAANIKNIPAGTISSTNVQDAINELDGEVLNAIKSTAGGDWKKVTAIEYNPATGNLRVSYEE